jgi:hypothetical protein
VHLSGACKGDDGLGNKPTSLLSSSNKGKAEILLDTLYTPYDSYVGSWSYGALAFKNKIYSAAAVFI